MSIVSFLRGVEFVATSATVTRYIRQLLLMPRNINKTIIMTTWAKSAVSVYLSNSGHNHYPKPRLYRITDLKLFPITPIKRCSYFSFVSQTILVVSSTFGENLLRTAVTQPIIRPTHRHTDRTDQCDLILYHNITHWVDNQ